MSFVSRQQVRFAHIDAAGIVFYPRYFEMLNAAVEDYFAEVIGIDFAEIHLTRKLAVPTVHLDTDFSAPSRLGDTLDFTITVQRVGTTSVTFAIDVRCGSERRFGVNAVLVCMALETGRSVPWPADVHFERG